MDKAQGTLIHGVAASQNIDSSGERINIENLDITSYLEGKGFLNYEHKSDTPLQKPGKIIYAKKILKPEDCENEAQKRFWNVTKAPYVYVIGELFDVDGKHESAMAVASVFNQEYQKSLKQKDYKGFYGFSVEGQTLEKNGSNIEHAVARGLTITSSPCNKTCIAELYVPEQKASKSPLDFLKSDKTTHSLQKAMTASGGNVAPSNLTGGSALQSEEIVDKKLYKEVSDFVNRKLSKKSEKEKSDIAKALYERFLNKAEDQMEKLLKVKDIELLDFDGIEAPKKPKEPKEPKVVEPLSVGGQKLTPNVHPEGKAFRPKIENGALHTPRGSLPIILPHDDKIYHEVLNSPSVVDPFKKAMSYYMPVQKLAAKGQIPDELLAHSMIHSLLSANNPVPAHEGTFAHVMDIANKNNVDIRSQEFAEGMSEGGKLRRQLKQVAAAHKYPQHASEYFKQGRQFRQSDQGGEGFRTLGFLDDFSEKMSRYPAAHQYLKDLHEQYGNNAQGFVSHFLKDKTSAKTPADHPAKSGFGIAGKTGRYAGLMVGKGNALVNDTHLMRHLFGLNYDTDSDTIHYVKDILSRPNNHHLLNQIDEIYQEHPAVRQVQKEYFGGKKDPQAIGPGFWRHWLTISPHEKALGGRSYSQQEGTTHEPYWIAAKQILDKHGLGHVFNKSEQKEMPIFYRTALAHKELEEKLGKAPADMVFYGYIAPLLMGQSKIQKSEQPVNPKKIIKPPTKPTLNQEPRLPYSQRQWYRMSYNDKKRALSLLERQKKQARGEIPSNDDAVKVAVDHILKIKKEMAEKKALKENIEKSDKNFSLKAKHKSKSGGLTEAGRKAYNKATGSNLKRPQPEGGARKKSFCARNKGQIDMHNIDCRKTPEKRACLARKRWKC